MGRRAEQEARAEEFFFSNAGDCLISAIDHVVDTILLRNTGLRGGRDGMVTVPIHGDQVDSGGGADAVDVLHRQMRRGTQG